MSRIVALLDALNSPVVWEDVLPVLVNGVPKVLPRLLPLLAGHGLAAPLTSI